MNRTTRNALVVANLPLVGYLVRDVWAKATHLDRDDLASAGALALVTSAESFDESLGVPFGAFARRRILGAFADEMRANDWATRTARRRIKESLAVQETLSAALGRVPRADEVASAMGVDVATASEAMADAARTVTTLDDTIGALIESHGEAPDERMMRSERTRYLRAAVTALPEKMRYIVEQVYFHDRTVKELAAELGATHSAVSQQRSEAMRLIRDGLGTHYAGSDAAPAVVESRVAPARRTAYLARLAEHAAVGLVDGAASVMAAVGAAAGQVRAPALDVAS